MVTLRLALPTAPEAGTIKIEKNKNIEKKGIVLYSKKYVVNIIFKKIGDRKTFGFIFILNFR